MRRDLGILLLGLLPVAGCAGVARESGLPSGWQELATPQAPFAALYRLECCARRNLLVTLSCDGSAAELVVTVPPGAALVRAWLDRQDGWVYDGEARCVGQLPGSSLPLGEGRSLPLRPSAVAVLFGGGLPPRAVPLAGSGDRVEAPLGDDRWIARIAGPKPHVTEAALFGADGTPLLEAKITEHRLGRIPANLDVRAGGERFRLVLVSWRSANELEAPAWLALAPCREGG